MSFLKLGDKVRATEGVLVGYKDCVIIYISPKSSGVTLYSKMAEADRVGHSGGGLSASGFGCWHVSKWDVREYTFSIYVKE